MNDGLFPSTFFAESFFAYGFFGEYGDPVPPTPTPSTSNEPAWGGRGLTRLRKDNLPKGVYDETRDEAELFLLILAFLKVIDNPRP